MEGDVAASKADVIAGEVMPDGGDVVEATAESVGDESSSGGLAVAVELGGEVVGFTAEERAGGGQEGVDPGGFGGQSPAPLDVRVHREVQTSRFHPAVSSRAAVGGFDGGEPMSAAASFDPALAPPCPRPSATSASSSPTRSTST